MYSALVCLFKLPYLLPLNLLGWSILNASVHPSISRLKMKRYTRGNHMGLAEASYR
jgi:hypothetical protein